MKIIILLFTLTISIFLSYSAISTYRLSRRKFKFLDEWSDLNNNMIKWGNEIIDEEIKQQYLHFCINVISNSLPMIDQDTFDGKNHNMYIIEVKEEIISKYSNHIPSLKQSLRDRKINNLLK